MLKLSPAQLREFDRTLRVHGQMLVEVDEETRWLSPESYRDDEGRQQLRQVQTPLASSGYALAKAAKVNEPKLGPRLIYVSDVNNRHTWHRVVVDKDSGEWHLFTSLREAARSFGVL